MAQVRIQAMRAAAITGGGPTQDFTISGFGTPKAALFIVTNATADNIRADHAILGMGATDGSTSLAVSGRNEDAALTSRANKARGTGDVIYFLNTGADTLDGEAQFSAWITDGVRISWSNLPTNAVLVTVILFAGEDLSAKVGSVTSSATIGNSVAVTGVGFQPHQLIGFGGQGTFDDSITDHSRLQFGICDNGGSIVQMGYSIEGRDGVADANVCASAWSETYWMRRVQSDALGSVELQGAMEVTAFDADGFTVTTRLVASSFTAGFLALRYGSGKHWVGRIDAPTSTGTQATTAPGFKPGAVYAIITGTDAAADTGIENTQSGDIAFGIATSNGQFSNGIDQEDGALDANTGSTSDDTFIHERDSLGNNVIANLQSFDATGFTNNFTTVRGIGIRILYLAVEESFLQKPVNEVEDIVEGVTKKTALGRAVNETERVVEQILRARGILKAILETERIVEDVRDVKGKAVAVNEVVQLLENVQRSLVAGAPPPPQQIAKLKVARPGLIRGRVASAYKGLP